MHLSARFWKSDTMQVFDFVCQWNDEYINEELIME